MKETAYIGGGPREPTILNPRIYKNRFREAMSRCTLSYSVQWPCYIMLICYFARAQTSFSFQTDGLQPKLSLPANLYPCWVLLHQQPRANPHKLHPYWRIRNNLQVVPHALIPQPRRSALCPWQARPAHLLILYLSLIPHYCSISFSVLDVVLEGLPQSAMYYDL